MDDIKTTFGVTQGIIDFEDLDKPFEIVFVYIFDTVDENISVQKHGICHKN